VDGDQVTSIENGDDATAPTPLGTDGGAPSATGPNRVDANAASSKTTSYAMPVCASPIWS